MDGGIHTVVLTAGPASDGFSNLEVNGALLPVGLSAVRGVDSVLSVTRLFSHSVRLITPSFELELESSDLFINLQQLRP